MRYTRWSIDIPHDRFLVYLVNAAIFYSDIEYDDSVNLKIRRNILGMYCAEKKEYHMHVCKPLASVNKGSMIPCPITEADSVIWLFILFNCCAASYIGGLSAGTSLRLQSEHAWLMECDGCLSCPLFKRVQQAQAGSLPYIQKTTIWTSLRRSACVTDHTAAGSFQQAQIQMAPQTLRATVFLLQINCWTCRDYTPSTSPEVIMRDMI